MAQSPPRVKLKASGLSHYVKTGPIRSFNDSIPKILARIVHANASRPLDSGTDQPASLAVFK